MIHPLPKPITAHKPLPGCTLDWEHPLLRGAIVTQRTGADSYVDHLRSGMVGAYLFNDLQPYHRNYADPSMEAGNVDAPNRLIPVSGSANEVVGHAGVELDFTGNGTEYRTLRHRDLGNWPEHTIAFGVTAPEFPTFAGNALMMVWGGYEDRGFWIKALSSGSSSRPWCQRWNGCTPNEVSIADSAPVSGQYTQIAYTLRQDRVAATSQVKGYQDGRLYNSAGRVGNGVADWWWNDRNRWRLGVTWQFAQFVGRLHYLFVWDRVLAEEEVFMLHDDPWGIFTRPEAPQYWSLPAGGPAPAGVVIPHYYNQLLRAT